MSTIWSFPNRGHWGNNKWRGNCSGHIYYKLFTEVYRPKLFVDPMCGGNTSLDVCKELKIPAIGLDLHSGFNILRDSILEKVGEPSDLIVSHPPYHDMIYYSGPGGMWGDQAHPDDLSRCESVDDFNEKLHLALMNQREAVVPGGLYGTIIGDLRRKGKYYSFQAECIARMPETELKSVIIKGQHNVQSNNTNYSGMNMPRIMHEYVLLWEKPTHTQVSLIGTLAQMANTQQKRLKSTWRIVVKEAVIGLGGVVI